MKKGDKAVIINEEPDWSLDVKELCRNNTVLTISSCVGEDVNFEGHFFFLYKKNVKVIKKPTIVVML